MVSEIGDFVKRNQKNILYIIAISLLVTLSFSLGYISAKIEEKEPLEYERMSNNIFYEEIYIY